MDEWMYGWMGRCMAEGIHPFGMEAHFGSQLSSSPPSPRPRLSLDVQRPARLTRAAMAQYTTPNKRDEKRLQKQTSEMIEAFAKAGNEAFESCLSSLTSQLRDNEPLVWRLSAIMKNPALVALLDGSLGSSEATVGTESPSKGRKLRASVLRFKHLQQQPGIAFGVLQKLVPDLFGDHYNKLHFGYIYIYIYI